MDTNCDAPLVLAYFYPGWCSSRAFDEWKVVAAGRPGFDGHLQPRRPLWEYDLDDPSVMNRLIDEAESAGLDGFVFCWYWDRGLLRLPGALRSFLSVVRNYPSFQFALLWVNRRPHDRLPIREAELDGDFYAAFSERSVSTDLQDLSAMAAHCGRAYWSHPNYLLLDGRPALFVFSVRDLLSNLGPPEELPAGCLRNAFGGIVTLIGVAHGEEYWLPEAARMGLDGITSYVLLPDWHGSQRQRDDVCRKRARRLWDRLPAVAGLPYYPAVTVGWDAACRGAELVSEHHRTFPWSPIVVGSGPAGFQSQLEDGLAYAEANGGRLVVISSWNEWSEGHYLEADDHFGTDMLDAVRAARDAAGLRMPRSGARASIVHDGGIDR